MKNFKVYCDMDSVLTDWVGAVQALGIPWSDNPSKEEKRASYKAIAEAGEPFWSDMAWMPDGQELWEFLKPYNPVLLSSPGKHGKFPLAASGKMKWVKNNIPGTTLIIESDKFKYAEMDAILIDDMQENVGAWKECGGIGILHTDAASTRKKFLDIINQGNPVHLADHIRWVAGQVILPHPIKGHHPH
jgi:hypothetical protein